MPISTGRRFLFDRIIRQRVLVGVMRFRRVLSPVLVLVASVLVAFDAQPWRVVMVLAAAGLFVVLARYEGGQNRDDLSEGRAIANVWLTASAQMLVVVAVGGLGSPVVAATIVFAALGAALLPRGASLAFLCGFQLPSLWGLALAHTQIPHLTLPVFRGVYAMDAVDGPGPWMVAAAYSVMLVGATLAARGVRRTIDGLVETQLESRDQALAVHAEQGRTMTALSASIAHELKNPLASVKGLAALLERDVDGVGVERLAVLRREVDRMQTALDEFLTYSRPLVPLELEEVDVLAVARDVVALHEGVASEFGLTLDLRGERTMAMVDKRKVRAVLMNLVTNALEASSSSSSSSSSSFGREGAGGGVGVVEILVGRGALPSGDGGSLAATVRVVVRDRGTGLAPAVVDRLFTVGVTSKADGNGIGLAVARGVARQHGGELTLQDRSGGGAEAVLTVPVRPTSLEST